MTEEEQQAAYDKASEQMDLIVSKIAEKGTFFLSLATPASYMPTESDQSETRQINLNKTPSYLLDSEMKDEEHELIWKEKVTEWRSDL